MSLVVNATSTKLTPHWSGGPKLKKKLKLGTKMLVFKIGGSKLPFYEKRGPKVHLSQFTF